MTERLGDHAISLLLQMIEAIRRREVVITEISYEPELAEVPNWRGWVERVDTGRGNVAISYQRTAPQVYDSTVATSDLALPSGSSP